MNRFVWVIHFAMGAAVGVLAKQAGYSFLGGTLWVVGIVALSTVYGAVELDRKAHQGDRGQE